MTIAIYPGTFDPVTNGHLDIAPRAARLFEKVIIGVYDRPAKSLMFTTEQRIDLIKQAIAGIPRLEAVAYKGLTIDFARQAGAGTIVRGLRIGADFEREFEMALMNKKLAPDCELVCLMTSQKYAFLSSSLLKEVVSLGGYVDDLVPRAVALALKEKFHDILV